MIIVKNIGVVGAGTMGSAIAQKLAQENFNVILADKDYELVKKGIQRITGMLTEGIERKVFSEEEVDKYLSNIKGTHDLNDLAGCDLIIEAVFENFNVKKDLFGRLANIVRPICILATNTSSYAVSDLAASVSHPECFIGLHFFYHAAKNRLVEIIPGDKTSKETVETLKIFSMMSGKDAIVCRDSYGFAVNRFFVPWLNEATRLLEENIANIATIDDVCMKQFGIGMGPFALMNATGVPVAYHSEKTLERLGTLYTVSRTLTQQALSGKEWNLDGTINTDEHVRKIISDRMLGIVFFVCTQILDESICSATDLNKGARIGLKWRKGPIELMQDLKEETVTNLVSTIADMNDMPMPESIGSSYWEMEIVHLEKRNDIAIITFDRPEDLNALNETVVRQLDKQFTDADNDPLIKTIFITGSGKAFVAGADIKFFVKNIKSHQINNIESFTGYGQEVFRKIDESKKKVVSIINGLALGGGLELALCADVILALPKAQMAFPETGIGIYPGLGGTQRCAGKIGKPLSKYLIHTGKMLSAKDAEEIGLVDKVVFIDELFDIYSGKKEIPARKSTGLSKKWQAIEHFFRTNPIDKLVSHNFVTDGMPQEDAERIFKTMRQKAPIALNIADKLIEEAKGCDSELKYLGMIFSTSDALLGLTSIGKRVEYQGN